MLMESDVIRLAGGFIACVKALMVCELPGCLCTFHFRFPGRKWGFREADKYATSG